MDSLIKRVIKEHKRIIFNGNGYDEEWIAEAERRDLLNLKTTPDALPYYVSEKNLKLFSTHGVFTPNEARARYEIALENYCKVINIEALTMLDIASKDILPAVTAYSKELSSAAIAKKQLIADADCGYEKSIVSKIAALSGKLYDETGVLKGLIATAKDMGYEELSRFCKDSIIPTMEKIRSYGDELETITAKEYWPMPSYGELLFSV